MNRYSVHYSYQNTGIVWVDANDEKDAKLLVEHMPILLLKEFDFNMDDTPGGQCVDDAQLEETNIAVSPMTKERFQKMQEGDQFFACGVPHFSIYHAHLIDNEEEKVWALFDEGYNIYTEEDLPQLSIAN